MAEKGKEITTKLEEEEEEENVSQVPSVIMLPPYLSPWKGTTKILKDLEAMKSMLQTPLLLDEISFDGLLLGCVPNIKFKDWDLTDNEKFPQFSAEKLLQ